MPLMFIFASAEAFLFLPFVVTAYFNICNILGFCLRGKELDKLSSCIFSIPVLYYICKRTGGKKAPVSQFALRGLPHIQVLFSGSSPQIQLLQNTADNRSPVRAWVRFRTSFSAATASNGEEWNGRSKRNRGSRGEKV